MKILIIDSSVHHFLNYLKLKIVEKNTQVSVTSLRYFFYPETVKNYQKNKEYFAFLPDKCLKKCPAQTCSRHKYTLLSIIICDPHICLHTKFRQELKRNSLTTGNMTIRPQRFQFSHSTSCPECHTDGLFKQRTNNKYSRNYINIQ